MPLALTPVEQEVVFLKAIYELIDTTVNFELLTLLGDDPNTQIQFKTITHQRFFNIALVDFLSCTDSKAPVERKSYLSALRSIANAPSLAVNDSAVSLRGATADFVGWLNAEVEVDIRLASINVQTTLPMKRVLFLKMAGDIAKHNVLRAVGVAEELQALLSKKGHQVSLESAMLALADFYSHFHTNILGYHSNTIAEFLNNVRWGIYEYLQPEFARSIVWESHDPPRYQYTFPMEIRDDYAKECYWSLMNDVRTPPYMRRFQVSRWLKLRY